MAEPPICVPHLVPVYGDYVTYGYIIVTVPLDRAGLGLIPSAFTTVEAVLGYRGVYAELRRFSGFNVYRVPVRQLGKCQIDAEGYFVAWAGVKYRVIPTDPSPDASALGEWVAVF